MKYYKLTKAQKQGLYGAFFTLQKKQVKKENIVDFGIFIEENFNPEAMSKAINLLLKRNDSLRLRIVFRPNGFRQCIMPYSERTFDSLKVNKYEDFVNLVYSHQMMVDLFDKDSVLAKLIIVDNGSGGGGAYIACHHIVSDGYSIGLMHKKIDQYYWLYCEGIEPPEEKEYSIKKVFQLDEEYQKSKNHDEDKKYWRYQYNHQPRYTFPCGRIPFVCHLGVEYLVLEGQRYKELNDFCTRFNVTQTAALMALTSIVVNTLHGDVNFALYTLTHGRTSLPLRRTIGCMMNAYPVFYEIDDTLNMSEYLEKTYNDYLEALTHARLSSTEQILMAAKETYIKRFGYNHLWIIFSTMDYMAKAENLRSILIDPPMSFTVGTFYCAILNEPVMERTTLRLNYQNRVYNGKQVRKMLNTFATLLDVVTEMGDVPVKEITSKTKERI